MQKESEIEAALDKVMDQYQRAGVAYKSADSLDKALWSMAIMDSCSSAIDALSWVLEQGMSMDGKITGECCDPANPYTHEDKETEGFLRDGYQLFKDDIARFLKGDK